MAQIDLNCDLGEGGPHDSELLSLITSANVACGSYAGDPKTMFRTISEAKSRNVRVGAHPGYYDRENFGRKERNDDPELIFGWIHDQIAILTYFADKTENVRVCYIKPHGALYNQACRDGKVAKAVIRAAMDFDLPILALPNSALEKECKSEIEFVREGFADRRYRDGGMLVPRDQPNAFVESPEEAVEQAERLITEQNIRSLCVHGDNPDAVAFVRKLREHLISRGHEIKPFA